MSKTCITKQDVQKIANQLAVAGLIPTQKLVRNRLGKGSGGTIQKYLSEWKQECFKNFASLNKIVAIDNNSLLEEHRFLKLELQKQLERNEHYAQELIDAEKANIDLKEENHQLKLLNQDLQLSLTEAKATNNVLKQVTEKIQNELNLNANQTIQKLRQTIDDLRLELKTLNETSIAALRETSNQGHEVLMQEKVNSINLQAKIDALTKELLESKKQLNETIMTTQVQNRSLTRKNEELQKIIQEHSLKKSPQLEGKASLEFTKGAVVYGK